MRLRSLAIMPVLFASLLAVHCGGSTKGGDVTPDGGTDPDAGGTPDASGEDGATGRPNPDAVGATTSSKVDLLLVVDNSASMGDKAQFLSASIGTLLRRVVSSGDVHVGVVKSSLGAFGGDVCANTGAQNTFGHLNTVGPGDVPVANAAKGFLTYGGGGSTDVDGLVADAEKP